jgi:hypothetical protein
MDHRVVPDQYLLVEHEPVRQGPGVRKKGRGRNGGEQEILAEVALVRSFHLLIHLAL